ncbi:hypothetical protein OHM78_06600 [Coxiella burnetii]|nr:hypothetical protein [Coxiella burnetii]UYK69070.1 hypothetical protein OHM78_06600 [Coxiella burnetii]
MSEAKYGDDRRHHRFPVFRFAHTGYLATGPARRSNLRFQSHPKQNLHIIKIPHARLFVG